MSKKIVPNCLCMIRRSKAGNDGKFVTTRRFIGTHPERETSKNWEVDQYLPTVKVLDGTQMPRSNIIDEHHLMRIDNWSENKLANFGLIRIFSK